MKHCILVLSALILSIVSNAQNEVDALRYSDLNPFGTARFTALGGAMGALGGDVTTMSYNPAGIGVYRSNTMVFTPSWTTTTVESNYHSSVTNSRVKNNIHLANVGFVSANEHSNEFGFEFVNFGFSYNQLANFNRSYYIAGQNNNSSFLDAETTYLNSGGDGYSVFYQTYLVDDLNGNFINPYTLNGYGSNQSKKVQSSGYAGEYNFNIAANVSDRFFAGLSLGVLHVTYKEQYFYKETPLSNPELVYFNTENQFVTRGNGLNLKIGVIARANQYLRLGAAVHTPTLFKLTDNFNQEAYSEFDVASKEDSYFASTNGNDIKYQLSTPFKAILSAVFIYKKLGFISVDYEYLDYSSMNLQAQDYDYITENNQILNLYKAASNIKVGGEYKLGPLAARLGFAYYQSAFNSEYKNKIADTYVYSGGFGLRSDEMFIDFTAKYALRNEYVNLYDSPNDAFADLGFKQLSYLLSIGFKF